MVTDKAADDDDGGFADEAPFRYVSANDWFRRIASAVKSQHGMLSLAAAH